MERFKIHPDKGPAALITELLATGGDFEIIAFRDDSRDGEHFECSHWPWAYLVQEDENEEN